MSELSLDRAISDHLALCRRNRRLERRMPLDIYRDQVGGGLIEGFPSDALLKDEPETEAVVNTRQEQWWSPGRSGTRAESVPCRRSTGTTADRRYASARGGVRCPCQAAGVAIAVSVEPCTAFVREFGGWELDGLSASALAAEAVFVFGSAGEQCRKAQDLHIQRSGGPGTRASSLITRRRRRQAGLRRRGARRIVL